MQVTIQKLDQQDSRLSGEKSPQDRHHHPLPASSIDSSLETQDPEKEESVSLLRLFRFASSLDLCLILTGVLFSGAIGAAQPLSIIFFGDMMSTITSASAENHNLLPRVKPFIMIFVYLGTGVMVGAYLTNFCWVLSGENQARRIRQKYLHAILRQDMGWFDKSEGGSLTTRLASDTQMIQDGISEKFGNAILSLSQFVAGVIVAFIKNWHLSLILLATLPVMACTGLAMSYFITRYTLMSQDSYADAGAVAEQVFSSIRTVYSFSLQSRFLKRYGNELDKAKKAGIRRGMILGFGIGTFMFIMFSTYGLALWYGARLTYRGELDGSTVLVVFLSIMLGAMSLLNLPPSMSALSSARGAAHRIFATIDRVPSIDYDSNGLQPEELLGHIVFRKVHFKYPTRPSVTILKSLDLDIKPGMTVAFVGPSGSGKSTAIQLLQRFYDPLQGQVLVDNHDIKSLNVQWLRGQIGVVSQEPVLFNMTIRENLMMGIHRDVREKELVEACRKSNCHDFIQNLPHRYDTLVGEHGGMLSGGQKQRICIARAILKNPSILLLDEATSALDTQSERLVQNALEAAAENRTTIVIAHRLSTIRNADLIVVMDKGVLVEQGTHAELIKQEGVYADLVQKQAIAMENNNDNTTEKERLEKEDTEVLEEKASQKDTTNYGKIPLYHSDTIPSLEKSITSTTIKPPISTPPTTDIYDAKRRKAKEEKQNMKVQNAPVFKVVQQMRPEWPLLALGCLGAGIAGTIFPLYTLLFVKIVTVITDASSTPPGPFQGANLYAFLLVVIGLAAFAGWATQLISFEIAGERYTKRLRQLLFESYMKQEVGFYDQDEHSIGSLTSKLAVDAKNVNEMVTRVWGDVIQLVVTIITGLSIAFSHSWILTFIILAVAPFIIAASGYESKVQEGYVDSTKKANEQSGEVAGEAIKEIRTVTALDKQAYFEDRFHQALRRPHRAAKRKAVLSSFGYGLTQGIVNYTNAVAFYGGVRLMDAGRLQFEPMFVVMMAILVTAQNVGRTSVFASTFAKAKYSALTTMAVMERRLAIDPDLEGLELSRDTVRGAIDLDNISFRYPARSNISIFDGDFALHANAGQSVALVGPSGCGKSTVIGMLQRWYDPEGGTVELDGHATQRFGLYNLRSHMALVSQEPTLFDVSIGDNIRFGVPEELSVSQQDIEDACKAANIHKFIMSLPQGYDTRVGDKGSQLSGGQKQRISIARALIRKPRVLLLDEATSALDSESEKLVQASIDNILAQGGRTTITIAHRLSTIQDVDLICVVNNGRIVEQGSHWDLLKQNGLYCELVHQQSLTAPPGP